MDVDNDLNVCCVSVPVVEDVLQPTTNTVIGPLWVTRGGEKFSFKGPYGFVKTLLEITKERFKEAKGYENQVCITCIHVIGLSVRQLALMRVAF